MLSCIQGMVAAYLPPDCCRRRACSCCRLARACCRPRRSPLTSSPASPPPRRCRRPAWTGEAPPDASAVVADSRRRSKAAAASTGASGWRRIVSSTAAPLMPMSGGAGCHSSTEPESAVWGSCNSVQIHSCTSLLRYHPHDAHAPIGWCHWGCAVQHCAAGMVPGCHHVCASNQLSVLHGRQRRSDQLTRAHHRTRAERQ
jgi:hypothetical protein